MRLRAVTAAMVLAAMVGAPALGQTPAMSAPSASRDPAPASPAPSGVATCLTKTVVENGRAVFSVSAVVASSEVAAMGQAGFVAGTCQGTTAEKQAYRARICALAVFGNEAVRERSATLVGADPAVLCARAKLLAGTTATPAEQP